jgi:hypothetical protein
MVRDAIGGKGLCTIARELNDAGILTLLGKRWRDNSVRRILTSPALMGHSVEMKEMPGRKSPVMVCRRDDQGQPVMFTDEPLITEEEFRELQRAISERARARGVAQARHLLWNVAFCDCGGKLSGHRRVKHAEKGSYYSCNACHLCYPLERMEAFVVAGLMEVAGGKVRLEQKIIAGDDHAPEIRRLERKAERLRSELADEPDDDLAAALATTESRVKALRADHVPDSVDWVPVANRELVRQWWKRNEDTTERNAFLRRFGVTIELQSFPAPLRFSRTTDPAPLSPFGEMSDTTEQPTWRLDGRYLVSQVTVSDGKVCKRLRLSLGFLDDSGEMKDTGQVMREPAAAVG